MNAKTYGPEAKARAISALLLGGRPRVVAREHGIPESTVTTWRHRIMHGKLRHEKKGGRTQLGGLLTEALEASLRSLAAQSERMADPAWIRRQGVREMAILHGTLFDATLRALELLPGFLGVSALPDVGKTRPAGGRVPPNGGEGGR